MDPQSPPPEGAWIGGLNDVSRREANKRVLLLSGGDVN